MITKSIAPDKPGTSPESTGIGPVDSPEDAGATGTKDFHTDGHQLPDPGIAHQTAPIDTRDRSEGGHLDRTAWAYDFARRHQLTKPERAVLLYMVHRASPQRLFQCDDSEEQIGEWTDYQRKAVNRAIKRLVASGAIYQVRKGGKGKGGEGYSGRYRLRGNETGWRVNGTTAKSNATRSPSQCDPESHGDSVNATRSPSQCDPESHGDSVNATRSPSQCDLESHGDSVNATRSPSQCDPESKSMRPGVPHHPDHHPVLPPVVSFKDETTTTTTHSAEPTQHESLLSSHSFSQKRYEEPGRTETAEICEDCGKETSFRNHDLCVRCLTKLFWPQLGPTWEKGPRAAARWYASHPDDFDEQLREAAVEVFEESRDPEADQELISAAPSAPPPDLGGGTFCCNRCGLVETFGVAFDGYIHRDYPERQDDGTIERLRCGGTWERVNEGE